MTKIKVGINGMGRIGRTLVREITRRTNLNLEIVAVNNPGPAESYRHLLKYDSIHGTFDKEVELVGDKLIVGGHSIKFFSEFDPAEIDWSSHEVDIVLDATGRFNTKADLGKHLGGSVKKVIMCAPGKDLDGTFVVGINHQTYNPDEHHIISNASCTTNCLAPLAKVLNDTWGIQNGFMTTIHSYTSDQLLLDGSHSDFRRARSAAMSMVPTTTGAAKAVGLVIPELKGKLDGYAVRVPTPNVSLVDLTVNLKASVTKKDVNNAMKAASEGSLKGILHYEVNPLVSIDFTGSPFSSIFDSALTNIIEGNVVKVVSWYDNEAGFSNRVIDLAALVGQKL